MCGIAGYVTNADEKADRGILERMNRAITHRGPDEDGFYVKNNAALAISRLSIIDLAGGQQPIRNADGSKWIVYNGEVYNYKELREGLLARGHELYTRSDTEAVLHLFEDHGPESLQHLRGMFAFAIWDEAERSLFLARDRVGKKPLLYSHLANGGIVFGSEFRAILEHPSVSREVDPEALDAYFSYLCVPAPSTAFKQIRKLEPGHWLRWKNGRIETQRYWRPEFNRKIKISEPEAIEETTRILRESTRLRMISEVPLGAFLSGGVDSSTVVAVMAQESSKPVKTFSIGFEDQDYSELKYARKVADHIGAEYHEFIVKPNAVEILPTLIEHYGEPFADSSAIPTYYVSRETRKYVTVALNGDGGDESFGGYERYAAMRFAERYHSIPGLIRKAFVEFPVNMLPAPGSRHSRIRDAKRFVASGSLGKVDRYFRWCSAFDPESKRELLTEDFKRSSTGDPRNELEKWFKYANGSGIAEAAMFADMMTYLPNDLLVKVDIASMANSLEARSPFLDHKLIEFAASLPEEIKTRGADTKTLLKKVAANLVPREVVYRKKMGFGVPIGDWLRGEMAPFVNDILLSDSSRGRGIVRNEVVEKYIREHRERTNDHATHLWTLLVLELWFRQFIDRTT